MLDGVGGEAVLQVVDVAKSYGDHVALHGVDLEVGAGEVCGLLGPNGAGKTTLVSIIAGLRTPDRGRVLIDGLDIAEHQREARQAVGFASQETAIYPTVTVRENLELFTRLAGYSGAAVATRLDEVAETVELTHLMDRQARNLSGGEARRLHTAMALVHRPKVLMLDEPTTGVDIATRTRLLEAIATLTAQEGCAVLYSTHYLPEVEALGASVAILDHGRILARGPLDQLIDEHGSGLIELTFDGDAPPIDGAVVSGSVARIATEQPGIDAAAIVGSLGAAAEHLVSVDLSRPSLETVFLAVTGRAYRSDVDEELVP